MAVAVLFNAGCSAFSSPAVPSSSKSSVETSPAADSQDYSVLLIKEADVNSPGGPVYAAAPPTLSPAGKPGVSTTFATADGSDVITDTILVLPDAQSATNALLTATPTLGQLVTGTALVPIGVGAGGVMQSGSSPDGTKAVTVVLFTQGPASVTLEFDRPPADPVNSDYAIAVARKQDDAINAGLHG